VPDESIVSTGGATTARESGFTLVEVLIATVIMIVGVFGLMAVFPQAYRTTKASGRQSVLHHLASEKLDELRSLDPDHADLGAGTHPPAQLDANGDTYYPVAGFDDAYSLRWTVLPGPTDGTGTAVAGLKTVVVEATHGVRYDAYGDPIAPEAGLATTLRTVLVEL
jgi:type II secretory pathway pseudopilin PulG